VSYRREETRGRGGEREKGRGGEREKGFYCFFVCEVHGVYLENEGERGRKSFIP
jgi:hypothetical protein